MQTLSSLPHLLNPKIPNVVIQSNPILSNFASFNPPIRNPNRRLAHRTDCFKHDETQQQLSPVVIKKLDDFCVIPTDVPFDEENLWSNFGVYLFCLHVPMSFGGLSVVASIMNVSVLDPQIEALSLLTIEGVELIVMLSLLNYTAKPEAEVFSFLKYGKLSTQRNWLMASAVGFSLLILLIYVTSSVEDVLFNPKGGNNLVLKEILQKSDISRTACFIAYCFIIPVLEETVYRGYMLSTLASKMKWQSAVLISSIVFSAVHFSVDDVLQIFIIGCVLGCSYCCTGNLRTSILIHSLYNAVSLALALTF